MVAHFLDCVRDGVPCRSTGEDGLQIMRLVEAAYRSLRSGATVSLV